MLTRRHFVTTALGAGAALTTGGLRDATAQVNRRQITDAQLHLWPPETDGWKYAAGLTPQLPQPFTIERAVSMMDEAGVDRSVIVPPSWTGERNDYALEAVKRYPTRFRVMGRFPLGDPKALDLLPKWKEQPGMVGIRLTFNTPQTIAWLTDGTVDRFWPVAEKAGLPIMIFTPGRTALLGPVAEKHPQLQLILDHMCTTASMVADGTLDAAIGQAVGLAKYPNVSVKISASPGLSREKYPFPDVAGLLKRVFDAYGPQRSYWGTDITNSYAKASYRQRITHFTEELSFFSESDKDMVMGKSIMARLQWT